MAIKVIDDKFFFLSNKRVSYVMEVREGHLLHVHFGKKITCEDVSGCFNFYPLSFSCPENSIESDWFNLESIKAECPTFGSGDFRQPMVKIKGNNGEKINRFIFKSWEIIAKPVYKAMPYVRGGETLVVSLFDEVQSLEIKQYYTLFDDCDALLRHNQIINHSNKSIELSRFFSFNMDFDGSDFHVVSLYGKPSCEAQISCNKLGRGVTNLESNCGISSHKQNPFVALSKTDYNEHAGEVYGVNLVYSGSFKLSIELCNLNTVRLSGGINDNDFSWKLMPGDSFLSPEAVIVYSPSGLNGMSAEFSKLYRQRLLPNRANQKVAPIVINSWEAAFFDFDENKLKSIIDSASGSGIDTFVLDDGWFGKRNRDNCSLGDWHCNTNKIKCGLKGIKDYCTQKGLKFGLWVEPEMISEDSDLFRAHPDYYVHCGGYKPSESRHQYILDLVRDDVFNYLKEIFYQLIKTCEVDYIKWDMNRYITENYSSALASNRQGEFNHRYTLRLYELIEYLTSAFPDVIFEGCCGGGGRVDAGMLYYFSQIWASDATCANERAKIMYGWSLCYPLCALSGHVSKSPNLQNNRAIDFNTRADIAMLGAFGYELDLNALTKEECDQIPKQCELLKKVYPILQNGNFYRLLSPFASDYFSVMAMDAKKERGYLWFYQRLVDYGKTPVRLKLKGLDENKTYHLDYFDIMLSGSTLMNVGLAVPVFYEDFKSLLCKIEEVNLQK